MQKTIYTRLRDAITREVPVAVATVITGDDVGAQVLIQPDQAVLNFALIEQVLQVHRRSAGWVGRRSIGATATVA